MSNIGYYRVKVTPSTNQDVYVYINGIKTKIGSVIVKPFCDGFKLIKFLDKNGKYRFYPFNKYWQQTDKVKQIGTVNKFITNILTDQSDSKNIGYTVNRTMSLVAENVEQTDLETLSELFSSPIVYLLISNSNSELDKDWLQITITGDGIGNIKKGITKKLTIEVTLPKQFTQTLL